MGVDWLFFIGYIALVTLAGVFSGIAGHFILKGIVRTCGFVKRHSFASGARSYAHSPDVEE